MLRSLRLHLRQDHRAEVDHLTDAEVLRRHTHDHQKEGSE